MKSVDVVEANPHGIEANRINFTFSGYAIPIERQLSNYSSKKLKFEHNYPDLASSVNQYSIFLTPSCFLLFQVNCSWHILDISL